MVLALENICFIKKYSLPNFEVSMATTIYAVQSFCLKLTLEINKSLNNAKQSLFHLNE